MAGQEEFDFEGARRARDAGIETAARGATLAWMSYARDLALYVARHKKDFTTDDVWAMLVAGVLTPPRDKRALGAVMQGLAREGLIEKTGEWRESHRKAAHARPVAVWKGV